MSIGGITPPIGLLTFIAFSVGGIPLNKLGWTIWVYASAMLVIVLLLIFYPPLVTYIPSLFLK